MKIINATKIKQVNYFVATVLGLSLSCSAFATEHHKEASTALASPVAATAVQSHGVNINTADAKILTDAHLKGIGKKRSEAIVAYREKNGPFKSLEDLKNIHGISDTIINDNKTKLAV